MAARQVEQERKREAETEVQRLASAAKASVLLAKQQHMARLKHEAEEEQARLATEVTLCPK